jgi:hypothetical protein
MKELLLGVAPNANWIPLFGVVMAPLALYCLVAYTVKLIKRKLHKKPGQ